jgi:hypothetical protein
MRKVIIDRINKLKAENDDFKSEWWEKDYVSFTMKTAVLKDEFDNDEEFETEITINIAEVEFEKLNDKDLVRLFEYVIRQTVDYSEARVNNTFFNPEWVKKHFNRVEEYLKQQDNQSDCI